MKIRFYPKAARPVKLSVPLFIGCQLLFLSPTYAQENWRSYVKDLVTKLVENQKSGGRIYVHSIRDESNRQIYYPFMKTIGKVMAKEFRNKGFVVGPTPANAGAYVMTTFLEKPDGVFLNASLINAEDGSTVLSSTAVEIPATGLPEHWKERTLRDVAFELAGKLEQKLFAQKIKIILGEFSGGYKKKDTFVSEFSATMKGYIKEEMIKSGTFVILSLSKKRGGDESIGTLKGRYVTAGNDIIFRLILQKGGKRQKEIANVSTKFPSRSVPQGMAIFPPNIKIAKQNTDVKGDKTGYSTGVPVSVWTNKSSGIYRDNDKLIVYIRPDRDCYARVYYLQSDGTVVQIFPSHEKESGFLRRGLTYEVGGKEDDVELVVSDETVGQEFIKVFASRLPIDDSFIPKEFIRGANVYVIRKKYRGLRDSLTRAIKMPRRKLLPAAETKILVK